ncbi:hypothetical protein ACFT2C_02605 [Promicromonospora sp. NPDC057138]|uniref:hypothetical protein n=1 Tax=Promicromonospora sp. NPDC057138 TaxID=3346031 RepID=UPI0036393FBD
MSLTRLVAVPVGATLVETGWYLVVATVLSAPEPQRAYARSVGVVDRVAGTSLGGLEAYFAVDGIRAAVGWRDSGLTRHPACARRRTDERTPGPRA